MARALSAPQDVWVGASALAERLWCGRASMHCSCRTHPKNVDDTVRLLTRSDPPLGANVTETADEARDRHNSLACHWKMYGPTHINCGTVPVAASASLINPELHRRGQVGHLDLHPLELPQRGHPGKTDPPPLLHSLVVSLVSGAVVQWEVRITVRSWAETIVWRGRSGGDVAVCYSCMALMNAMDGGACADP